MDRNRQIAKVAAPGDPAPGGSTFDYTFNPWINDRGDIAFEAHVAGEECNGPGCVGIYFKRAGATSPESVAHQGEQAPDGWRYYSAWGAILNNRSDLVFIGAHRTSPVSHGIYLHSRGATSGIAAPSDIMPDGRKITNVNPTGIVG